MDDETKQSNSFVNSPPFQSTFPMMDVSVHFFVHSIGKAINMYDRLGYWTVGNIIWWSLRAVWVLRRVDHVKFNMIFFLSFFALCTSIPFLLAQCSRWEDKQTTSIDNFFCV
jgi:uncharacterized membrane protein YjdF